MIRFKLFLRFSPSKSNTNGLFLVLKLFKTNMAAVVGGADVKAVVVVTDEVVVVVSIQV